jgi:protein-tyrosine phosphatase
MNTVSMIRRTLVAVLAVPFLVVAAMAGTPAGDAVNAVGPQRVSGIKIENFGVVDGRIYRGGQPAKGDYRALASLGVTTIVDLREDAKQSARAGAESAGLRYVNIGIDGHGRPADADVAAFLRVLDADPGAKVYVHCAGGRHRTGSMLAVYRMVRDGWTLDQAYNEMLAYDFYTGNGHGGFKTYVEDYWKRMISNPASVPAAYKSTVAQEAR